MQRQNYVGKGLHRQHFVPSFSFPLTQLIIGGLIALAIPPTPTTAATEFQVCAYQLQYTGLPPEKVSAACSEALKPKDLSRCVVRLNLQTQVVALDALDACLRVRQPIELANCVLKINKDSRQSVVPEVVDFCRRSLLPVRFSECVVGLIRQLDITTNKALQSCIAADDFPRELFPTLVPPPPSKPTIQLTPIPEQTPQATPSPAKP